MTLAQQFSRFQALLEPLGPLAAGFVSSTLRERLDSLPQEESERLLAEACDRADEAGDDLAARLRALSRPPLRATTPAEPTTTIDDLIEASDSADVVGAVAGAITNTWRTHGYTEYRISDGGQTLVIGVHGRSPLETPEGQRVIVTVALPHRARAITEPVDPARPSVLGAVAATLLGYRAL